MNWTNDQKKIIDARNGNLLVSAAAGSGKTAVLVERILEMISDPADPVNVDELLVVTFTKAAAAQMKEKIGNALERLLSEHPDDMHLQEQINALGHANIQTIDSFCYRVVKEHFHVLGLDPAVRIGEAGEIGLLREEALKETMEEFYAEHPDFVSFSEAFSEDKRDERIEAYIRKVYEISASYPRPEEWTRMAREALRAEDEAAFMKLSYMQGYLAEAGLLCRDIIRRIDRVLKLLAQPNAPAHMTCTLKADQEKLRQISSADSWQVLRALAGEKFDTMARAKKTDVYDKQIAEQINKMRTAYKKEVNDLLAPFSVPFENVLGQMEEQAPMLSALLDATDRFRECFLERKLKRGVLEFSDVEHFALQILCQGYGEDGSPVPSRIGQELSEDFREILIDEYQDSNFLQEAILHCVSRIPGGQYNIFMVGDVKQSIYSFRMARPDLFMDKYHRYASEEGAVCRKLLLKNNFRSRSNVLYGINYVFQQIMGAEIGGLDYGAEEALVPGRGFPESPDDSVELLIGESREYDVSGEAPESDGSQKEVLDEELNDIGKIELEASLIAGRIERLMGWKGEPAFQVTDGETGAIRDVRLGDIVILFRSPSRFASVFTEIMKKRQIEVRVQNENGYFDTPEIRLVLSLLRVADNPFQDVEAAAALRGYFGHMKERELAQLKLVKNRLPVRYLYQTVFWLARLFRGTVSGKHKQWLRECLGMDLRLFGKELDEFFREQEDEDGQAASRSLQAAEGQEAPVEEIPLPEKKQTPVLEEEDLRKLSEKCAAFVELVEQIRDRMKYETAAALLRDIYYDTGYYYYTAAMPGGSQRTRNLELLLSEAESFGAEGFCGIFHFLRYVEQLEDRSIALGGDPMPAGGEDAVRIMSIHRSKGLEFPVVFVAGLGKKFNLTDTRTPLIIHPDYYVCAKYVDVSKRWRKDTISRKAVAALMTTENLAEELRVFYVGLTRAKEKLILTGVTRDIPSLVKKNRDAADWSGTKLPYGIVRAANSYLELVVAALMRHEAFHKAMYQLPARMDQKGEETVSAVYERNAELTDPSFRLKVQLYDYQNLVVEHLAGAAEQQMERERLLEALRDGERTNLERLQEHFAWKYRREALTSQKSKMAVTEIQRIYEMKSAVAEEGKTEPVSGHAAGESATILPGNRPAADSGTAPGEKQAESTRRGNGRRRKDPVPRFIQEERKMNAGERGTWMHKLMELLDLSRLKTREQVREALEKLWDEERLPEETREFISEESVWTLLCSPLGKRMREAAGRQMFYKEKQFIIGVPASKLAETGECDFEGQEECKVVVQGIIDAYFREGDSLILLDYKTDQVGQDGEKELAERYRVQLGYYRDTLEQMTGLKVAETYLYSFCLGREIRIG